MICIKNAIRPLTVGRRNWLFADTPDGALGSAIYYSLIESAKANGVEPFEYICYVLEELPYADTEAGSTPALECKSQRCAIP